MFETLFFSSFALHVIAPAPLLLSATAYLEQLAAQERHVPTMRIRAHYCLHVARELAHWPLSHRLHPSRDRCYGDGLGCAERGQRAGIAPKKPAVDVSDCSRCVPSFIDRLRVNPDSLPGRYEDRMRLSSRSSASTGWQIGSDVSRRRGQVVTFLSYLEEQGCDLASIDVGHVDVYFQHIAHRLSRTTLRQRSHGPARLVPIRAAQGWTQLASPTRSSCPISTGTSASPLGRPGTGQPYD